MDYQIVGLVFACIGVVMSVLYFAMGVSLLKLLRAHHGERPASRTPAVKN